MAPYVSCMYAPLDTTGMAVEEEGKKRIVCTDDSDPPKEWFLTEDSLVGDWLRYQEAGGTIDPAEEVVEAPGGPVLPEVERDYGAEIDALEARLTALEGRVTELENAP